MVGNKRVERSCSKNSGVIRMGLGERYFSSFFQSYFVRSGEGEVGLRSRVTGPSVRSRLSSVPSVSLERNKPEQKIDKDIGRERSRQ